MAWVYLDDGIARHPKIIAAGSICPVAPWLFVAGLAFCREHLTGGLIPIAMVPTLTPLYKKRALDALLTVELWEQPLPNTIAVHDYGDWNDQEDRQRQARSRKAQVAARARWNGHAQALPEQSVEHGGEHPPGHDAQAMPFPSPPNPTQHQPVSDFAFGDEQGFATTTSDLRPPARRRAAVVDPSVQGGWG